MKLTQGKKRDSTCSRGGKKRNKTRAGKGSAGKKGSMLWRKRSICLGAAGVGGSVTHKKVGKWRIWRVHGLRSVVRPDPAMQIEKGVGGKEPRGKEAQREK